MRINGYQCDDCGNIHNQTSLPEGWMELDMKKPNNWRKLFYFCSIGCLSAWAIKRKINNVEDE